MGFERVKGGYGSYRDNPVLSVYSTGTLRFNSVAAREWFDDVDSVTFYVDEEAKRLGIARGDGDYTVRRQDNCVGIEVYGMQALKALGVDPDELESSVRLELEHDPQEGLLVADAAPLLKEVSGGGR